MKPDLDAAPLAPRRAAIALAVAIAAVAPIAFAPARADAAPSREESQRADALFTQAKRALGEGRVAEACTLFAESQRLDPGGGTLYNLALCHAREGKTATARAELVDALAAARAARRADAEQAVADALRELEPRLSRVRVRLVDAPADVVVEVDGRAIAPDELAEPIALDPGPHTIAARASGREPFAARVELGPEADTREVEVLLAAPPPPPPAPAKPARAAPAPRAPQPAPPPPARGGSAGPWVLGAVGVVGLGVGAALGGVAAARWSDAKERCPARECADPAGVDASSAAVGLATGSTVAIALGAAAVGGAIGWRLLAPPRRRAAITPLVARDGGGATVAVPW